VNFLLDNQLPAALVKLLMAHGHSARHVLEIGLEKADDTEIWKYAALHSLTLITKDEDFFATRLTAQRTRASDLGPAG